MKKIIRKDVIDGEGVTRAGFADALRDSFFILLLFFGLFYSILVLIFYILGWI